ncbi:MAG: aminotransferase class V-fold PLP-dependent enzyme [bacterium]|nr:aminotransferase class V-fold PLP-dependent enzyme [bacterium]
MTAAVQLLPELAEGVGERLQTLATDIDATTGETDLWRRVRKEFQLNPGLVHFNTGSVGASPRVVSDAIANYINQLEGDPNHNVWGPVGDKAEEVRSRAAEFVGADVSEMVITRNTTEGMNQIASGIDLEPGDEVLTTNHEHGGGVCCWEYLQKHRGVRVNYMKMPNPVRDKAEFLRVFEQHLTPRTRVVSLMHIDTITGMVYPLADVAKITRPRGILLVCDGAHAPGMLNVNLKELGVDAFASSSHKWMLAPKGSGLLYIRREVQDRIHPMSLYSGYSVYSASMGTRNVAHIIGHGVAMDFHNTLGRDRVEARCRQLSNRLRSHLLQIPRLQLLTPTQPELSSGLVTFSVDGMPREEITRQLFDDHNIIVKNAQGTYAFATDPEQKAKAESYNCLRFSTHIFNNEHEVDRLATHIEDILG